MIQKLNVIKMDIRVKESGFSQSEMSMKLMALEEEIAKKEFIRSFMKLVI
jgi:hypothetical protein